MLRLVDPDALQPLVQVACQPPRALFLVREDEHGDTACLPIAQGAEDDRPGEEAEPTLRAPLRRGHVLDRAMSEEGQRDVEVARLDEPCVTVGVRRAATRRSRPVRPPEA